MIICFDVVRDGGEFPVVIAFAVVCVEPSRRRPKLRCHPACGLLSVGDGTAAIRRTALFLLLILTMLLLYIVPYMLFFQVWRVLAAVLHMSNVTFDAKDDAEGEVAAVKDAAVRQKRADTFAYSKEIMRMRFNREGSKAAWHPCHC